MAEALTQVRRRDWARLVGGLTRLAGDPGAAEDCLQEALVRAWQRWPVDGVPNEPTAWIRQTARHLALDRWRRSTKEASLVRQLAREFDEASPEQDEHDALAVFFAAAHPALDLDAQVALTLRWGTGLEVDALARAFLVSPDTMHRRLSRARSKVRESGIPLKVPEPPWRDDRVASVLAVFYLLFNQGNDAGPDEPHRATLATEAQRLTHDLALRLGGEAGEAWGLLALEGFTWGRRPARFDEAGALLTLDQQDRALWDGQAFADAEHALAEALARGPSGPYTLQAAIAGAHARSATWQQTPWPEIASLYARLVGLQPTPVVRLNHAIAVGHARGAPAALALLADLHGEHLLDDYPYFHAAVAEFLADEGRLAEAEQSWSRALALAPSEADRLALQRRRPR